MIILNSAVEIAAVLVLLQESDEASGSVDIYLANLATSFQNHALVDVRGSVQQVPDGRLLFVSDRVPSGPAPEGA